MKKNPLFRIALIQHFAWLFDTCVTKLRMVVSFIIPAIFLISCTQGDTKNYYSNPTGTTPGSPAGQNSMSGGGGATGDGGGGQGIQCHHTNDKNLKNTFWVRDIYEAVNNHGLKMKKIRENTSGSMEVTPAAIELLVSSIQSYFGPASEKLDIATVQFWNDFSKQITFLDGDRELFTSQDANSPIALPSGCQLVQIAYWDESSGSDEQGTLYVSRPLWEKMDQINKIGLLAHEYFFKEARKANYKNSDFTRFKIGQLLSTKGLEPLFKNWKNSDDKRFKTILPIQKEGFKVCEGTSVDDSTAKLLFYEYKGLNGHQHLVFPVISSKKINTTSLKSSNFELKPIWYNMQWKNYSEIFRDLSNYLIFQSNLQDSSQNKNNFMLKGDIFSWWYNNTGLLDNYVDDIEALTTYLKSSKKSVAKNAWQGEIPLPIESIKITLPNPIYSESQPTLTLKSKEELVGLLNDKLLEIFESCEKNNTSAGTIMIAIARLNAIISESAKKGINPDFTEWFEALQKIQEEQVERKQQETDPKLIVTQKYRCNLLGNDHLTKIIPSLLYSIKINLSYGAVANVLGNRAYNIPEVEPNQKIDLKLNVSQGESNVSFNLKCKDYNTVFSEKIRNSSTINTEHFEPNPNATVTYEESVKSLSNVFTKEEQLIQLGTFLNKGNSASAELSADKLKSACPPEELDRESMCTDYFLFATNLRKEHNIHISDCGKFGYSDSIIVDCAVVQLKNTNSNFVIRYNYDEWGSKTGQYRLRSNERPAEIEFIRHVPLFGN